MRVWIRAMVIGALVGTPVAGLAAIDLTHHDMEHMIPANNEKCAFCHSVTNVTDPGADWGKTGAFCVQVCHRTGTGATTANPGTLPTGPGHFAETTTYTTVPGTPDPAVVGWGAGGSHGAIKASLDGLGDVDLAASLTATNWPHSGKANMECTTCHAVHDASYPPFLNAALSGTDNAASFCQRCHTGGGATGTAGRYEEITAAGAHPTEFVFNATTAAGRTGIKTDTPATAQHERTMTIKAPVLYEVMSGGGAPNDRGTSWTTGGHFLDTTTDLPTATVTDAQFGCYSCHSAHQDATQTSYNGVTSLMLADANILCYGCHGDGPTPSATSIENPGISQYYHPVGGEDAVSPFPIPMSAQFAAAPNGLQATAQGLICLSCHDVHGGVTETMSIRQIGSLASGTTPTTATQSVCLGCHETSTDNTHGATDWHHPGEDLVYTAAANGNFMPNNATAGEAEWITVDNLGTVVDGLSCPDCHVFQGSATTRATAHNW